MGGAAGGIALPNFQVFDAPALTEVYDGSLPSVRRGHGGEALNQQQLSAFVDLLPEGAAFVSADGTVQVFQTVDGREVGRHKHMQRIESVRFAPDNAFASSIASNKNRACARGMSV